MHIFYKYWKRLLVKRLLVKNEKKNKLKHTVNSASTANDEDFIS